MMIASLRGILSQKDPDGIVIDVGGVGFQVSMPSRDVDQLGETGATVKVQTHLHVRENELSLYGFLTDGELSLFRALLGVSGVGPKAALAMLSSLSVEDLTSAIAQEQAEVLSQVPGIGLKTARKLILELREKLASTAAGPSIPVALASADAEVIEALSGLGYSIIEAQRALQSVPADVTEVGERLRQALQQLAP